MFRGRNKDTLPTASIPSSSYSSYSAYTGNSGNRDGSGRGIRMDSPIYKAWKNSSNFTKGTYYFALFNICLMYWGYRHISASNASIWLTCHAVECTVKITPPSSFTTTKLTFSRKQLVKTQAIKVDKDHNFVKIDSGPPMHRYTKDARKKQKRKKNNGGPDDDGNYDSYTMVLRPPIENNDPEDETAQFEVALSALDAFTYDEEGTDNRVLPMRQFNIGQTKRRTRTMTSKVDSYIQQRRHQLIIKENASLSWQGVLAVVFGLFFLLITFLVGSFFDELTTPTGGPGTRRKTTAPKKKTRKTVPGKYH